MKRIPEFTKPHLDRIAESYTRPVKIRRILHSCGHEQGHAIEDGFTAPDEYKRLHGEPCGACAGECQGSWDGPDVPEADDGPEYGDDLA